MQDKTTLGISEELRQFIEALVEEVVLEGKTFEEHKKYLSRFCQTESIDYNQLETNLSDLFETAEELKAHESKGSERYFHLLGKECHLADDEIENIISAINKKRHEFEEKFRTEEETRRKREAEERAKAVIAERKAKEEAEKERKARETAESKAEEEHKAREEAERKARKERELEKARRMVEEQERRVQELLRENQERKKIIADLEERVRLKLIQEQKENAIKKARRDASDVSNFVHVEGGYFSYKGEGLKECRFPFQRERVPSFYIGKYVVTQEQWIRVMGSYSARGSEYESRLGDRLPAIVTWEDAQRFIEKLNKFTGNDFRIPYETEWDYAAIGGKKTQHYKYCGSNDYDEIAWRCSEECPPMLHEVGLKKPNEIGLYDMCGNVEEWCKSNWGTEQEYFKGILKGYPGYGEIGYIDEFDNSDGFKSIWGRGYTTEKTMASFRLFTFIL